MEATEDEDDQYRALLHREFESTLHQSFIDGKDTSFDYKLVSTFYLIDML